MPVRVLIAVLMLTGATLARACPCMCAHAHPAESTEEGCPCHPAQLDDGGRPMAPAHDPHCPCMTGLAVDPVIVPQVEPLPDAPTVVFSLPAPAGGEELHPRSQPDVRPPAGSLPLYLVLLTLRN